MAPLRVVENQPFKPLTTFKIGGPARYFASAETLQDATRALDFARERGLPLFVLGGGSNVLISDTGLDAFVLHPIQQGVVVLDEASDKVLIRAEAGEPWDDLVATTVKHHWWGIENLSHIPGQAGAALIQNVGAYGEQISDSLESAEVLALATGKAGVLRREECGFAYRSSIFNTSQKGQYLILNLTLRLDKRAQPNLQYPGLRAWLENMGVHEPSMQQIREAIIAIRDRKFPFPRQERGGNAGSFFKNLILTGNEYEDLERRFHASFDGGELCRLRELRNRFPAGGEGVKIPTAFLIEVCGLKEYRVGGAQVNESQPLVLLNQGGATARDVLLLARHIRRTIYAKTGVKIAIEPELVGFSRPELEEYLAFE